MDIVCWNLQFKFHNIPKDYSLVTKSRQAEEGARDRVTLAEYKILSDETITRQQHGGYKGSHNHYWSC